MLGTSKQLDPRMRGAEEQVKKEKIDFIYIKQKVTTECRKTNV